MPSAEKIIEKMKCQPNGIRPEEAEKVLKAYGYEPVRQKGSHKHYLNSETGDLTTIKQENPLKKAYIVDILNRIGE
ncbi:MAG: type II toxin-antitoxin system HicA family toxin [Lachnospiraceae bacterium]|nr:type II toxin-antitoxin system HicA family toxin [Lachnospiraceae bacterium]